MNCPHCGAPITDLNAQYCSQCGSAISKNDYRIQLLKSEHRKIKNLNKRKLMNYVPTIKQVLYENPAGDYWIFLKIGKLEGFEAFRLLWAKYDDFNGKRYIGHCVDICNEKEQKMTNYLVLLVRKDASGVHFLEYDKIVEVMQIGFLRVFCIALVILYCCIAIAGLCYGADMIGYYPISLAAGILFGVSFVFPLKVGKKMHDTQ